MRYDWLKEKKNQANSNSGQRLYRVPLRQRFMSNTGLGGDNRLQSYLPTSIENGVVRHEGEIVINGPGATSVLDAASSRELASNPAVSAQLRMKDMQDRYNLPGMQTGGTVRNPFELGGGQFSAGNNFVPNKEEMNPSPSTLPSNKIVTPETTTLYTNQTTGKTSNNLSDVANPSKLDLPKIDNQKSSGTQSLNATGRDIAIRSLIDQTRSGSSALRIAASKAINDLTNRGEIDNQVLAQAGAQAGLDEPIMAARMARQRAEQEGQRADLAQRFGSSLAASQEGAAGALASQSLAGIQFDQSKQQAEFNQKQTESSQKMAQYSELLRIGDYDKAADIFEEANGYRPNMDKLKEDEAKAKSQTESDQKMAQYSELLRIGDYDKAAEIFEEANGYRPNMDKLKQDELKAKSLQDAQYDSVVSGQAKTRISDLITRGVTLSNMGKDSDLRKSVADMLGVETTDPKVDEEISGLWKQYINDNKKEFTGNFREVIESHTERGDSLDVAISNKSVWENAAYSIGLDPYDQANSDAITSEITKEYDWFNRPDWQVKYDAAIKNLPNSYTDTPGWESEFREVIKAAHFSGALNEDGTLKNAALLPWVNPSTKWKYFDWNGNDIEYDENDIAKSLNDKVQVDGNGTDYVNSEGKAVTNADVNAYWSSLGVLQQNDDKYYDEDGNLDVESIIKEGFPKKSEVSAPGTPETTDFNAESFIEFKNETAKNLPSFNVGGEPVMPGNFVYYDKDGAPKIVGVTGYEYERIVDGLKKLYVQEKGKEPTPVDLMRYYDIDNNKGQSLRVDENYNVTKSNNPVKAQDFNASGFAGLDSRNVSSSKQSKYIKQMGYVHFDFTYNGNVYKRSTEDTIKFEDKFVKWANANVGKLFQYDGNTYTIMESPIVEDLIIHHEDVRTQGSNRGNVNMYGEGLRVKDESGKETVLTFGTTGNLWD